MDFVIGIVIGVVATHILSDAKRRTHFFSMFKSQDNGNKDNKS